MEVSVGKSSKWWISHRCGAASRIDLAHVRRPIGGGPHEILRLTLRRGEPKEGMTWNDCGFVPGMWLAHGP